MNNMLSSVVLISFLMINNAFSNIHMSEHREFSSRLLPTKLLKDLSTNLDFKNGKSYLEIEHESKWKSNFKLFQENLWFILNSCLYFSQCNKPTKFPLSCRCR